MNILKSINGFFKKNASLSDVIRRLNIFTYDTTISSTQIYDIYNNNSATSDAVDMIASAFSTIKPNIYKNGEKIINENVIKSIMKTNDHYGYKQFSKKIATNYLLHSNVFLEVLGNVNFKPISIYSVPNSKLNIYDDSDSIRYDINWSGFWSFLNGSFMMKQNSNRILHSNLKELYHIKDFDDSNGSLKAISKLQSIYKDIKVVDSSLEDTGNKFKNGFNASGVLNVDTDDKQALDQFRNEINSNHSGSQNSGKAIVTRGKKIDYTPINGSNRDMQTIESRKDSRDTIYKRFNIPQPLIDSSSQTYNNYQTAQYVFWDSCVLPLADVLFDGITKIFIDRKMLNEDEYISYDKSSISSLQLKANNNLKDLKELNILTLNELRTLAGREEIEGGNEIYINANEIPIGSDRYTDDNLKKPKVKFINDLTTKGISESEANEYWCTLNDLLDKNELL